MDHIWVRCCLALNLLLDVCYCADYWPHSGILLRSGLRSCSHFPLVLCVFSFSLMFLPCAVGNSAAALHCSWEYTLDGYLENRPFIILASASRVYLFSLVASAIHISFYYCSIFAVGASAATSLLLCNGEDDNDVPASGVGCTSICFSRSS